ncbi:hypothetical protein GFL38_17540 [Rhizobium leguminosarum bv. viciae]|nr:hypothetical protein [Rhizobium leguminosarum bv. viciae]NKQ76388.1 hypothetical protein [Rhizobium ruizarguesonis]
MNGVPCNPLIRPFRPPSPRRGEEGTSGDLSHSINHALPTSSICWRTPLKTCAGTRSGASSS